jgi:hypothetical protein
MRAVVSLLVVEVHTAIQPTPRPGCIDACHGAPEARTATGTMLPLGPTPTAAAPLALLPRPSACRARGRFVDDHLLVHCVQPQLAVEGGPGSSAAGPFVDGCYKYYL